MQDNRLAEIRAIQCQENNCPCCCTNVPYLLGHIDVLSELVDEYRRRTSLGADLERCQHNLDVALAIRRYICPLER